MPEILLKLQSKIRQVLVSTFHLSIQPAQAEMNFHKIEITFQNKFFDKIFSQKNLLKQQTEHDKTKFSVDVKTIQHQKRRKSQHRNFVD